LADIATIIKFESYSVMTLVALGLHLLFGYPFTWFLERHPGLIVKDLGCGFFLHTGTNSNTTWMSASHYRMFLPWKSFAYWTLPQRNMMKRASADTGRLLGNPGPGMAGGRRVPGAPEEDP